MTVATKATKPVDKTGLVTGPVCRRGYANVGECGGHGHGHTKHEHRDSHAGGRVPDDVYEAVSELSVDVPSTGR